MPFVLIHDLQAPEAKQGDAVQRRTMAPSARLIPRTAVIGPANAACSGMAESKVAPAALAAGHRLGSRTTLDLAGVMITAGAATWRIRLKLLHARLTAGCRSKRSSISWRPIAHPA
ncbi:hypothetical protein [Methylobacterium sp. 1030]|uniref:hypothetical protein n=1 Tax=Methylobacterium sp. 1030 TaxID=3156404 RepID=UPI0033945B08